ncbi:NAD(+) synthase [Prosthecomicrobium sp. N25]|uniref:NAD(+) synthase n=1 Tax=Prosthecomicrobium sp. N25 TaxID=3129254 RepID=UPI003FCCF04B
MLARTAQPVGPFTADRLRLDPEAEVARIVAAVRRQVGQLKRRGAVLGLSGGIDSSVTVALMARAFGPERVLGIFMPERDSEDESLTLGRRVAETFGVPTVLEDIGPALAALGCYRRRDEAIRRLVPDYGDGWACKVVIRNEGFNVSYLVVQSPDGVQQTLRMPVDVYLAVVAATNMKQRTRKLIEYTHADRLNFVVAGTPNRLEYDQGFFVKNGDGAADIKPIAHLYKSQVYDLAAHLGVPEDIRRRPPTTDTWSLAQTQEEFYFSVSWRLMDICMLGLDEGAPAEAVAEAAGLTREQVLHVWKDIETKRRTTRYLHEAPLLVA